MLLFLLAGLLGGATAVRAQEAGTASYYAAIYENGTMACGGIYHASDPVIAAVAWPERDNEWPCGQQLTVTGPAGSLTVYRSDSCRQCKVNDIDLSERGFLAVCGRLSVGRCTVTIQPVN